MTQKIGSTSPHVLLIRGFINVMEFSESIEILGIDLLYTSIIWYLVKFIYVCYLPDINSFTCWTHFLCFFTSCCLEPTMLQSFCLICLKLWSCLVAIFTLNAMTKSLPDSSAVLAIFGPITGFFKRAWSDAKKLTPLSFLEIINCGAISFYFFRHRLVH